MTRTPDHIVVSGISGFGRHGVFEHERRDGQQFVADVDLEVSTLAAARSDDLADTVDYGTIATAVHAVIVGEPVDLIETLAERIASACLHNQAVRSVQVTVHKPGAPIRTPFTDVRVRITRTRTAFALGLGSNLGESSATLQSAVDSLAAVPGVFVQAVSPVYRTAPVGGPPQPDFLNAVVVGETALAPPDLLACIQRIESTHHRERTVHWGPRTLDIDLLTFGQETVDTSELQVPHPRAHERGFVLVPWNDVTPDAVVPGLGRVDDLLRAVDRGGIAPAPVALRVPVVGG